MYYVYILRSKKNSRIYTGFSSDLKRRISEHKQGKVHTTARMGDVELIYYEAFQNEQDAREREVYLKTTQGKRTLKIMLKHAFAPVRPMHECKHHTW
jgi:putative endonuclease